MVKRVELPMQARLLPVASVNAEQRTVELVWTTGAQVRRYDWARERYYYEELVVTPEAVDLTRLNTGAPLLNTHSQWDLGDILGVVERAWLENGEGRALVRFSERPEVEPIWRDVQSGVIRNVSVGYRLDRIEMERVEGVDLPVYRVVAWTPTELSLVPVPADVGAGVRAADSAKFPCEVIERSAAADNFQQPQAPQSRGASENAMEHEDENNGGQQPADMEAVRRAAVEAERKRVADIRAAARKAGLDDQYAERLAESGGDLEAARAAIIDELARRSEQTPTRGQAHIVVVQDEQAVRREAIAEAVMHRAGTLRELPERARAYRGYTLIELARQCLEDQGVATRGLDRNEIAHRALMGTSDFAIALGNTVGRTLRNGYEQAPRTFTAWARQGRLADFRPASRVQVSGAVGLEKVNEAGEFKRGHLNDAGEQIQLETYGKVIGITRQVIINDDLDVLGRIPQMFGAAAAAMESKLVYAVLTGNPKMSDNVALFHASHANLAGAGAVLSVTSLTEARKAMRLQKDPSSDEPLNLVPAHLIVPAALETVAYQFTASEFLAAKSSDVNPFASGLHVIVEPRLDTNSDKAWYLAAATGLVDTVEYAYLDGAEGLQIATRAGFEVDGIEIRAYEDFAVKAIDHRGLFKNPGA